MIERRHRCRRCARGWLTFAWDDQDRECPYCGACGLVTVLSKTTGTRVRLEPGTSRQPAENAGSVEYDSRDNESGPATSKRPGPCHREGVLPMDQQAYTDTHADGVA